jgi:hypothetical protein
MSSLGLDLQNENLGGGGDPAYQLDVGGVLGQTFSVWGRNLVPFCLTGLIVQSPVLLGLMGMGLAGGKMPLAQGALGLVSNILGLILIGAVTFGVFRALSGEGATLGEIVRLGFSRLGTVWGTAILTGLAVGLGICALIIPGLILMARFWVSVPVAVIEEPGATAAMGRSAELTEGNRWKVFAVAVVLGAIQFGFTMACGIVLALLDTPAAGAAPESARAQAMLSPWLQALQDVLILPIVALNAVGPAVAYYDLRVGKEGADVEDLVKVFA